MTTVDAVGKTAYLTAQLRADEAQRPDPLFVDPFAGAFATDASRAMTDALTKLLPSIPLMLRLRTRYFDDLLMTLALDAGIRQIVILGAGFDARSLRFPKEGVRYFEVDRPAVLDAKRSTLEKSGVTPRSVLIAGDYSAMNLRAALEEQGFDASQPAFVLWEGNTMYLPTDAVFELFRILGELSPRLVLAFDYVAESLIASGNEPVNQAIDHVRRMGAPILTGFDDIRNVAARFGYTVQENHSMQELRARYVPEAVEDAVLAQFSIAALSKLAGPV